MQIEKLEFDAIRYNPELQGFEAAVRIFDGGHIFRYPTFITAPLNADTALVARGLVQKATTKHSGKSHMLRSFRPEFAQDTALAA